MKNKQFKIGAVLSYGAILFNIASGLLYTPWMIDKLGDDMYALYTLAISVINIFLLDFGIGSAVTKFLSNYYARGEREQADRFLGIVYKVFLVISAVIAVGLAVFYGLIDVVYAKLTAEEIRIFKQLFLIVGAYSVLSFPFTPFNGVLSANERFIELKACDFLQKLFNVLLTIVFLVMGKGVYALVLVNAGTNFVFLLAKYIFIRKNTRQRAHLSSWDSSIAKSLFGYSAWATVMSVAQRCMFNIMPTIVAATIGSAEVTLFSLASTLEGYVYVFASAINGMLMPKVSRAVNTENADRRLTELMTKVGKYQICTLGLLFVGFACLGRDFVGLWMGDGYEAVFWGALLLIFPSLISMPQQVASNALLVKDVVKEQALIYIFMAVLNLTLLFILIPLMGVVGASLSICISYLCSSVGKNVLYYKKLPIRLRTFFSQTYLRWLAVALCTGAFYAAAVRYVPLAGWTGLLVKACMIGAAYLVLYVFLCIDKGVRRTLLRTVLHRNDA